MRADRGDRPAARGDPAVGVDRAEPAQRRAGDLHRGGRRRVEQLQAGAVRMAPAGEFQREPGQVGDRDLRLGVLGQPLVVGRRPAPVDPARALPAGPAGALGGGRLATPVRSPASRARGRGRCAAPGPARRRPRSARPARSGCSRRRSVASTIRRRTPGASAASCTCGRLPAVQRQHVHIGRASDSRAATALISQTPGRNTSTSPSASRSARRTVAATWSSSRGSTCSPYAGRDRRRRRRPDDVGREQRAGVEITGAAVASPRHRGQPVGVHGRRRRQQRQVGAQRRRARRPGTPARDRCRRAARGTRRASPRRRRAAPGRAAAGAAARRWSPPRPGSARPTRRSPRTEKPTWLADPAADQRGHPAGRRPGGDPTRLGDDDPARERVGEGQRHQRRLAGAGRRDQHRRPAAGSAATTSGSTARTGNRGTA